jgi:hypothetical protein
MYGNRSMFETLISFLPSLWCGPSTTGMLRSKLELMKGRPKASPNLFSQIFFVREIPLYTLPVSVMQIFKNLVGESYMIWNYWSVLQQNYRSYVFYLQKSVVPEPSDQNVAFIFASARHLFPTAGPMRTWSPCHVLLHLVLLTFHFSTIVRMETWSSLARHAHSWCMHVLVGVLASILA